MRKNLITIHLYLAAFLAVPIMLIALSGGLYLLGIKGTILKSTVYTGIPEEINFASKDKTTTVNQFLKAKNIDYVAEKALGDGKRYATRPSSQRYYVIKVNKGKLQVVEHRPTIIRSLIELHKGHGPDWFRIFQKLTAFGILLVVISGLILGLTSSKLRKTSLFVSGAGLLLTILLTI